MVAAGMLAALVFHQRKDDSNREVKTKPCYDELQELALGAQDQESAAFVLQCMPVCHYCAYHQSMQCSICSLFSQYISVLVLVATATFADTNDCRG